jgi:hypothetical protein
MQLRTEMMLHVEKNVSKSNMGEGGYQGFKHFREQDGIKTPIYKKMHISTLKF